jgi:hypothetical protein
MFFFIDVLTWHGQQKGINGVPLVVLNGFYKQKVLVVL